MTFAQVLEDVRATTLDAYSNQDLPFDRLVKEINPHRDGIGVNAFSQYHGVSVRARGRGNERLQDRHVVFPENQIAQLSISVFWGNDGIKVWVGYSNAQFRERTIRRLLDNYRTVLDQTLENVSIRISNVNVLFDELTAVSSEAERHYGTVEPRSNCIHEVFENQVLKTPTPPQYYLRTKQDLRAAERKRKHFSLPVQVSRYPKK